LAYRDQRPTRIRASNTGLRVVRTLNQSP
jgi:hypothetical protein